jgi:uncharacterized protein YdaU (DUF1376 family)
MAKRNGMRFVRIDLPDLMTSDVWLEWSQAEWAAYSKLMFCLYHHGGSLPSSDVALAKLSGAGKAWPNLKQKVLSKFYLTDTSELSMVRCDQEFQYMEERSQAAKVKGALGGARKAENAYLQLSNGLPTAKLEPSSGLANKIEIENKKENNTPLPPKGGGKAKAPPMLIPTVEEVRAYMAERGWADPDYMAAKVHAHYELNKWAMSSGKKLKSWKHAVDNTWDESKYKFRPNPNGQAKLNEPRNTVPRGLPKMI